MREAQVLEGTIDPVIGDREPKSRTAMKRRSPFRPVEKNWSSAANGAVLCATSGAERALGSRPAGVIAVVGLRRCG